MCCPIKKKITTYPESSHLNENKGLKKSSYFSVVALTAHHIEFYLITKKTPKPNHNPKPKPILPWLDYVSH